MEIVACPSCGKKNRTSPDATGTPRCGNCHSALPWIVDADDNTFKAVTDRSTIPVLVDLWATWCGPCRQVTPVLERLAKARAGFVKLVKVDIDRSPQTARRFAVQAVPTLVVLNEGRLFAEQTGAAPASVLVEWLDSALESIPGLSDRYVGQKIHT